MTFQTPLEALSVLGLDQTATKDDIKSAYHRMAAYYHPDAHTNDEWETTESFLTIQSAYEYLMDAYEKALAQYEANNSSPANLSAKPRVLGNKADITRQKTNRHFAREHVKQEKRLQKEHQNRRRKFDEEIAARAREKEEEEKSKEYARRAGEVLSALFLYGGKEVLDKPFE